MNFSNTPLPKICAELSERLKALEAHSILEFIVVRPDISASHFSGERIILSGRAYIYRNYKTWLDLAERLGCSFLTPRAIDQHFVAIRLRKLDQTKSLHGLVENDSPNAEKYGQRSLFFRLFKLEEPHFMADYLDSLRFIAPASNSRVLSLGVNKGDDFVVIEQFFAADSYNSMQFVGIDHSSSAIEYARQRFPNDNFQFICGDVNNIDSFGLGTFDLVISIGTLQSRSVHGHELLRALVQRFLTEEGGIILGLPNSRYVDHEIQYGARVKNYSEPELSLVLKDAMYFKRYLQQHKFRVKMTGKYYLFVAGTRKKKQPSPGG